MNHLIIEADKLLRPGKFDYAFCGGFAIEMFLNCTVRKHGDIDVSAFWAERDNIIRYMQSLGWQVYEMCGGGVAHHITSVDNQIKAKRNIFCFTANCPLVSLTPSDGQDMFHLDFDHSGQNDLDFIEFLFNNYHDGNFVYARNKQIFLPLGKAILQRDEIPYLAPEMVLLYKSTDIEREGYQQDFEAIVDSLSEEQHSWLRVSLQTMNPNGHKWLEANALKRKA